MAEEKASRFDPIIHLLEQSFIPYIEKRLSEILTQDYPYLEDIRERTNVTYPYRELEDFYPERETGLHKMSTGEEDLLAGKLPDMSGLAFDDVAAYNLAAESPEAVSIHELLHRGFSTDPNLKRWQGYTRQMPLTSLQDSLLGFQGYPTKSYFDREEAMTGERPKIPERHQGLGGEELAIRRLLEPHDPGALVGPRAQNMARDVREEGDKEKLDIQSYIIQRLSEMLKYGPKVGEMR